MKKLILLLGLLIPATGFAQQYSIDWYKVAGGGGTSTGGVYAVSGTIGQPDASTPMTGVNYSLNRWFLGALRRAKPPGAPTLIITYSGNQAVVSWDPSVTGWTLQTNNNLAAGCLGQLPRLNRQ